MVTSALFVSVAIQESPLVAMNENGDKFVAVEISKLTISVLIKLSPEFHTLFFFLFTQVCNFPEETLVAFRVEQFFPAIFAA